MYQAWYWNFWELLRSAGVDIEREEECSPTEIEGFTSFSSFHELRKGKFPDYSTIAYPYSQEHALANVASGVADPTDMFAAGYASIDLQAEVLNPTIRLENTSLAGYLNSRRYLSKAALDAYEEFVSRVWGIPAYLISAADYRRYAAYCYGSADQDCWLSCRAASDTIVRPLVKTLTAPGRDVKICQTRRVANVICKAGRVTKIQLEQTEFCEHDQTWVKKKKTELTEPQTVEYLILAIPPAALGRLVREGDRKQRIADSLPMLRELARVQSERMPMLHLFFNEKLKNIPREPVTLTGSTLKLSFTDISQTRTDRPFKSMYKQNTVLAVSCSEPFMLPGDKDENARAIRKELEEFLDLDDAKLADCKYRENTDVQLSLNAIGTDTWRPKPHYPEVENLYFAGDFCLNPFGITTVEAAVATGLQAASALVEGRKEGPIKIECAPRLPDYYFLAMRYFWLPAAYAAWAVSKASAAAESEAGKWDVSGPAQPDAESIFRYLLTPGLPERP
jgi:predicted NAD/FAD-dependent oxidoreductase